MARKPTKPTGSDAIVHQLRNSYQKLFQTGDGSQPVGVARQPCPSDLTITQWKLIARLTPPPKPGGRPRKYDRPGVANALLYVNREGCTGRASPDDLPHWKTAYDFSRGFEADGTWDRLVAALRAALRVAVRTPLGRDPTPSGACIDSPSAKAAHGGAEAGVDGGKMARGRERRIVTDTLGLLLFVLVTAANRDDGTTAPKLLAELHAGEFPRLSVVWADAESRNDTLDAWRAGPGRAGRGSRRRAGRTGGRGPTRSRSGGWWGRRPPG